MQTDQGSVSHYVLKTDLAPHTGVALGKGEVGDRSRPHLKIRPHPKTF